MDNIKGDTSLSAMQGEQIVEIVTAMGDSSR